MPDAIPAPETPAGQLLAGWLAAVNSGDMEKIRRFVAETAAPNVLAERSAEARALSRLRLYENARGLALQRLVASSEHTVDALLRARLSEEWWRIRVEVEPHPPHRVEHLTLHQVPAPETLRERSSLAAADVAPRLGAYVDKLAEADIFSGAVLLAKDGVTLFSGAWGAADTAREIPNRVDTRFNLGSVNKVMTAVAIAQLAEAGALDFSDPVGRHLPGYPNATVRERVTLHHLLTHTSGLGTYFNPRFQAADKRRFRSVDDYDPLYADDPPAFAPGGRFSYSNSGFMVLGKVIEAVSGEDYFAYMRRCITGPAGMADTEFFDMDGDVPGLAVGYTRRDETGAWSPGPRRSNRPISYVKGSPAGGGFSTAEDLLRFDRALRGGILLLKRESVENLWTPKATTDFDPAVRHGYGLFLETLAGCRIAYHTGVFPGVNAHFEMHLDTGHTVIALSNYDPPSATRIVKKAREWLGRIA